MRAAGALPVASAAAEAKTSKTSSSSLMQVTQYEIGSSLCEYIMRLMKSENDLAQADAGLDIAELDVAESKYMQQQLNMLVSLGKMPNLPLLDKTLLHLLRSQTLLCLRSAVRALPGGSAAPASAGGGGQDSATLEL